MLLKQKYISIFKKCIKSIQSKSTQCRKMPFDYLQPALMWKQDFTCVVGWGGASHFWIILYKTATNDYFHYEFICWFDVFFSFSLLVKWEKPSQSHSHPLQLLFCPTNAPNLGIIINAWELFTLNRKICEAETMKCFHLKNDFKKWSKQLLINFLPID